MKTALLSLLLPVRTYVMAVSMPSGISETLVNLTTAGQLIGGGLASVFLVGAGIQHMMGTDESILKSKKKIVAIIVGIAVCAGCTVIKAWISSMMAF